MPWLLHTCGCSQVWCSESLKRINTVLTPDFLKKKDTHPFCPPEKMLAEQCFSVYINVCTAGNFVATKLLWQNLSRQKIFVTTKLLSQQAYFYCDNTCLLQQNICHNKKDTCGSSHHWYLFTTLTLCPHFHTQCIVTYRNRCTFEYNVAA